jgi:hypothetical protein
MMGDYLSLYISRYYPNIHLNERNSFKIRIYLTIFKILFLPH